eukprot:gene10107-12396_t
MKINYQFVGLLVLAAIVMCNALTLPDLRTQFSGQIVGQRDVDFNNQRVGYNYRYQRIPTIITMPTTTNDVVLALEYARTNNLKTSVKSGGHSASALSIQDDTVLIDLGNMKNIEFDQASMTITAQPGNRWVNFYNYSTALGVATPGGNCPSVGIGGLSLGGGANELATVWGHTVDNILRFQVVLANGSVVYASDTENSDLFWALRGAGHGGFGIVTEIKYKVYNIRPNYYSAWITYAWSDFEKVLRYVAAYSEVMPDTVNLYFTGWKSGQPTQPSIGLSCFYNGDPAQGETECGRFRNIDGTLPTSFSVSVQPFFETVRTGTDPKARRSYTKGAFLTELSNQAIRRMRISIENGPSSPFTYNTARLNLYWHGGQMLNKSRDYTSYVHRSYPWNAVWLSSFVTESLDGEYHDWIKKTYRQMNSWSSGEVYQNYQDDELEDWEDAYYAENYPRLKVLKAKYDPTNYFNSLQSIRPSQSVY